MTEPSADTPTATPPPPQQQSPRPRHRLRVPLILLSLVLLMAGGFGGATWTGYRLYDEPFVRFNENRLRMAGDTLWRNPNAVAVVALGSSALRYATLDDKAMAALPAKRGVPALHFLRIVNDTAEFTDFGPLLERIVHLKPALLLIDFDLAFAERRQAYFYQAYLGHLAEVAESRRPYLRDQIALQYDRPCTGRTDAEQYAGELRSMLDLRADSPAFEQVRAFVAAAQAAGIRVAFLPLPRSDALAERLYGAGNAHLPAALQRAAELPGVPVWRYPQRLDQGGDFCDPGHLGESGRTAYSSWLTGQIAEALNAPPAEAVSSLPQ